MTTCVRPCVRRNPRRGFTLIEVLMAAFVLAIGVLGLTALFAGAARQQQLSSQTTRSVAAARSADAFITERFGPIERVDGDAELLLGTAMPKNDQGSNTNVIQNDQWYAVPRGLDGSLTLNPRETTTGWADETLFSRSMPREVLPRLLFRNRVEERNNTLVRTGIAGGPKGAPPGTKDVGLLDAPGFGAPSFDGALRELRAIADSITLRVVVREFPCAAGSNTPDERSLTAPVDTEIRLRWNGATTPNQTEFLLTDGTVGGTEAIIYSDPTSKDAEITSTGSETELTYVYIDEVVKNLPSDPGCGTAVEHWVERLATPSDCDAAEGTLYLWSPANPSTEADVAPAPSIGGDPGYDIRQGTEDGKRYLYAVLRAVDRCNTGSSLYRRVAVGSTDALYVIGSTDDPAFPPTPGAVYAGIEVRKAHFPTKFIHEIWLEDYRYRAHTLASLPETISYSSTAGADGARIPQIGYSMVFRRRADSSVQYALISYAIAPTYPAAADRADTADDDFFPVENAGSLNRAANGTPKSAPIRLVNLPIEFDEDLGQYYVALRSGDVSALAFVAVPGQVLLFNGDAGNTPPIPGADGPVRVVSVRRLGVGEVRAYLDGPPRAGLRALTDFNAGNEFDAWVVQAKCEVTQRVPGKSQPIYSWALRPIDARLFTVSP